jgi:hypothetical protein
MNRHADDERQRDLSAAARAMAAARRVVGEGKCQECGTTITITTAGRPGLKKRYCSPRCNQAAYRRRHAEELRERQRERYAERRANRAGDGERRSETTPEDGSRRGV